MWSIAGFDPSSGAGVTADLMTFAAHGLFGCAAITALTQQNTMGVFGVHPVPATVLLSTLTRLQEDMPTGGIKIGMLHTAENVVALAEFLERDEGARPPHIVLDPVLRSSSGAALLSSEGVEAMQWRLLPRVGWVTPNWMELAELSGLPVRSPEEAEAAARTLVATYPGLNVVATGGDQVTPTDLVITDTGAAFRFTAEHIASRATHGTGCAFSSALLAQLALGGEPHEAVAAAKAYVRQAILSAPGLGGGKGPMGLLWPLQGVSADAEGLLP